MCYLSNKSMTKDVVPLGRLTSSCQLFTLKNWTKMLFTDLENSDHNNLCELE